MIRASTPCFYRAAASLLTTAPSIEVLGPDSSGEAEFIVLCLDDGLWIGTGSDHTDRKLETQGVAVAKQFCAKPVAASLWRYADVADHWDDLMLRSFITEGGSRTAYQDGAVAAMRAPEDLIQRYEAAGGSFTPGTLMFCGTLPVMGEIRPAAAFEAELVDPVKGRSIRHAYDVIALPVVS